MKMMNYMSVGMCSDELCVARVTAHNLRIDFLQTLYDVVEMSNEEEVIESIKRKIELLEIEI